MLCLVWLGLEQLLRNLAAQKPQAGSRNSSGIAGSLLAAGSYSGKAGLGSLLVAGSCSWKAGLGKLVAGSFVEKFGVGTLRE